MRYIFVGNKTNKYIMTFSIANQKENNTTRTTIQRVKHIMYSNNEVSISGIDNIYIVWLKQGSRISQKASNLNLIDAVIFANKFIRSI